jgi:carbonic anhydrase
LLTVPATPAASGADRLTTADELVAANAGFAATFDPDHAGCDLSSGRPTRHAAVVTCMDARIDVLAALGLGLGEVHVIRNAGGLVTDDVLRSLTLSQRTLGTREVLVIQHTGCGLHGLADEALLGEVEAASGVLPPFAFGGFADLDASVRASVARVRAAAYLPHRDGVRGFVYDLATGRLRAAG